METLRISRHVNRRLDTVPIHYDVIRLKYVCNLYTDAGGSTDMDSFYRSRSDEWRKSGMLRAAVTWTVELEREPCGAVTARPRLPAAVDELVAPQYRAAGQHITTLWALVSTSDFLLRRHVYQPAAHGAPAMPQQALATSGSYGFCHQLRYCLRTILRRHGRQKMIDSLKWRRWLRNFVKPKYLAKIHNQHSLPAVRKIIKTL